MATEVFRSAPEPEKHLARYSLLDALLARRSRRFGKGMRLNGGPLAYESVQEPEPLSLAEEAVLAFVNYKYAQGQGTLRDGGAATNWRDGAAVEKTSRNAAIASCGWPAMNRISVLRNFSSVRSG